MKPLLGLSYTQLGSLSKRTLLFAAQVMTGPRFVVPRRTHDVKIGYIPILMLILSVKASQVLVVPKLQG